MTITREDYVTKSVNTYLTRLLTERGYTDDVWEMRGSYSHTMFDETPLTKSYVCTGFNFDNGGTQAEIGSNLKLRLYTIELFIIGVDEVWAKNLANAVKFSLENDLVIPLLDVANPALPQIDALVLAGVSAEHQPVPDPKPWQHNIWTVHARVEDTYLPSAAVA